MVSISGVLQDGSSYDYTLHGPSAAASADPHNDESSSSDDLIGLREVLPLPPASDSIRPELSKPPPQRFVKARLSTGDYLMCAVTDGFKYAYSTLSEAEVRKAVGLSSTQHANGSSSVAAEDELPPSPAPSPPIDRVSSQRDDRDEQPAVRGASSGAVAHAVRLFSVWAADGRRQEEQQGLPAERGPKPRCGGLRENLERASECVLVGISDGENS